jgi:hypothetical protein
VFVTAMMCVAFVAPFLPISEGLVDSLLFLGTLAGGAIAILMRANKERNPEDPKRNGQAE